MSPRNLFALPFLALLLALSMSAQQPEAQPHAEDIGLPIYPPLAIQAQVQGRVEVEFTISQDGSITGSKVLSGPPLLVPSVQESFAKSRFTCGGCKQAAYTYHVNFDFVLPSDRFAKACAYMAKTGKEPDMPCSAQDAANHVTVRPKHPMCLAVDPATPHVRAAHCLWLWKCGVAQPRHASGTSSSGAAGDF